MRIGMKIGYHSANVIYRYDPCVILALGSCVLGSWDSGWHWVGWLQTDRQTEGLTPTLQKGPVAAWSDCDRFGMVLSNVGSANTKNHVNLSKDNIDVSIGYTGATNTI